jgi:hypothetical protein
MIMQTEELLKAKFSMWSICQPASTTAIPHGKTKQRKSPLLEAATKQ